MYPFSFKTWEGRFFGESVPPSFDHDLCRLTSCFSLHLPLTHPPPFEEVSHAEVGARWVPVLPIRPFFFFFFFFFPKRPTKLGYFCVWPNSFFFSATPRNLWSNNGGTGSPWRLASGLFFPTRNPVLSRCLGDT